MALYKIYGEGKGEKAAGVHRCGRQGGEGARQVVWHAMREMVWRVAPVIPICWAQPASAAGAGGIAQRSVARRCMLVWSRRCSTGGWQAGAAMWWQAVARCPNQVGAEVGRQVSAISRYCRRPQHARVSFAEIRISRGGRVAAPARRCRCASCATRATVCRRTFANRHRYAS